MIPTDVVKGNIERMELLVSFVEHGTPVVVTVLLISTFCFNCHKSDVVVSEQMEPVDADYVLVDR